MVDKSKPRLKRKSSQPVCKACKHMYLHEKYEVAMCKMQTAFLGRFTCPNHKACDYYKPIDTNNEGTSTT